MEKYALYDGNWELIDVADGPVPGLACLRISEETAKGLIRKLREEIPPEEFPEYDTQ